MAQGILVFIEQRDGHVRKASLEALSEASRQAAAAGGSVTALIVGNGAKGLAGEVSKYKPAKIWLPKAAITALTRPKRMPLPWLKQLRKQTLAMYLQPKPPWPKISCRAPRPGSMLL